MAKLYIVGTPIGNLGDISQRAIDTLNSVDAVACEDTRHTGQFLQHLKVSKKLISLHDHNEAQRSVQIIERIKNGESIALVSDAGMPGISDPGYKLINAAKEAEIEIEVIPGPVAFTTAAVISGLPTDRIFFSGFLPAKTSSRKKALTEFASIDATLAFYESPKRLASALRDAYEIYGDRKACVVRELTKLYEESVSGTLGELSKQFADQDTKGEIVLLIDRTPVIDETESDERTVAEIVNAYIADGVTQKDAIKKAAKEKGLGKSEAYRIYQQHKDEN